MTPEQRRAYKADVANDDSGESGDVEEVGTEGVNITPVWEVGVGDDSGDPVSPEALNQANWDDINQALLYLALTWVAVVTFAGSMLFARAVIPSLVVTKDIAPRLGRLRLPIYAVAAVAGLAVIILASLWISSLGFLYDIFDRTWY